MCLFRPGKKPHHIPTVAREVFDVSGAGDTVIATLVLGLTAKADAVDAAEISNHAAGVVVGKVGTATCSTEELIASFLRNRR
jgi:D-beta-D-heptose 7-phosphate kinase/D-beta-D-heptose 1-phosphate adenosyltransferase